MAGNDILGRIAGWQAAGLIDGDTADRLRAAEAASKPDTTGAGTNGWRAPLVGSWFGPTPSIVELFSYVGAGFLLAAWHTLSLTSSAGSNVIEWLVPAVVFGALGAAMGQGAERGRRAAGVAFAIATGHVFGAATELLGPAVGNSDLRFMVSAAIAAIAAVGFRRVLGSVLTQLGLLVAGLVFAGFALSWLGGVLFPGGTVHDYIYPPSPDPNAAIKVVLRIAWWLAWAVIFGAVGLREAAGARMPRADDDGAAVRAARRAAVTRFVAGMTAVFGALAAIMTSRYDASGYGRVIEPWLGDGIVLVIAVGLLGFAIRRSATAYLYPAALGVIVAFSDLNAQYVAGRTGVGVALLLEGLILIGAGILAERLRRRLGGSAARPADPQPTAAPG